MKTLGQIAFEAYFAALPPDWARRWATLNDTARQAWEDAARAVKEATIRICIEAADCQEQFPEKNEGK